MKITMQIESDEYTITLNDSQAARDFSDLLPLTLTLKDYANTEKVADLPKSLEISDSPSGTTAAKGDVTYYAPWGNLAIFYKDFRHSEGLIRLGKLDQGIEALTGKNEDMEVAFVKPE